MGCFSSTSGSSQELNATKHSTSIRSSTSTSTDGDTRRFYSRNASDRSSTDTSSRNWYPNSSRRTDDLQSFTFDELKAATKNFSRSLMLGEGGFGGVYRGVLRSSQDDVPKRVDIAVKQLSKRGLQARYTLLFSSYGRNCLRGTQGMDHRSKRTRSEHPNLVKLIGYCAEDDERGIQRLLVYEYMPNRSVQDHLSSRFQAPIPWLTRLKIAQDAARGLAYLHEGMDFQIIFRDFKPSNILLDEQWKAKLSDFGLARLGPVDGLSHVSTAVVGTAGYAAPEYIQTGRLTSKSDVWSFGVFLYELLTGRRPLDPSKPKNEQQLLNWIKPYLSDQQKLTVIMDPRLQGGYSIRVAHKLVGVANKCLGRIPKMRPRMSEVVEMISEIVDEAEAGSPELSVKHHSVKASMQKKWMLILSCSHG
ncbi:LOW QUALITY PROTEIN: hypothetical protein V2J09_023012 [Rumex salicifolius]